jgi:putative transposase
METRGFPMAVTASPAHDPVMSSPKLTKGRHSETGGFYSITAVACGRRQLFSDPRAARAVICELDRSSNGNPFEHHAWVLMPDHLHWLVELRDVDLSAGVQAFKSRSARSLNIACGRSGRVWQPGFYDHRLRGAHDLQRQARCIIENPVRAGLAACVEGYPYLWCSWGFHAGGQ